MLGKYIAYKAGKRRAHKNLEEDLYASEQRYEEEIRRLKLELSKKDFENGQYPNHE